MVIWGIVYYCFTHITLKAFILMGFSSISQPAIGDPPCVETSIWKLKRLPWELDRIFHKDTSSTAQGGGGSFKNRKPIGEVGCCESGMAERSHWWTERCLISLTLSISFSDYLPTYLSIFYVSIYLSISLFLSSNYPIYLSICLSV